MSPVVTEVLVVLFIATQVAYLCSFAIQLYFFTRPVNWVDMSRRQGLLPGDYPFIVLFYPVLHEAEATMRTTFEALARLDYPADRFEIIAIPNASDQDTIRSLERMQRDFAFLQLMRVPPTTDPAWQTVWTHWNANDKVYWWHRGRRAHDQALPPKKTRQLIYAFYKTLEQRGTADFLVNYIDADSAPPQDHFLAAAVGMRDYDVLQSTNIAGNLNTSLAASLHSFDHMAWDGRKYPHMSADGRHPYWVLGKGLFFRASDLVALGGFNPWITIEDPEVGMRFWKNGRRLGIIRAPLIEEVPSTFGRGVTQRKRWVAGFWQSLTLPLNEMGFTPLEKFKAWLNFVPCMSLWINAIGLPVGVWALATYDPVTGPLPVWTMWLAGVNLIAYALSMTSLYIDTWKRSALVCRGRADRAWYLLRVNPVMIWIWWMIWLVPLWIGWRMYRRDRGLVWERTTKVDANHDLVRELMDEPLVAIPVGTGTPMPMPAGHGGVR